MSRDLWHDVLHITAGLFFCGMYLLTGWVTVSVFLFAVSREVEQAWRKVFVEDRQWDPGWEDFFISLWSIRRARDIAGYSLASLGMEVWLS